MHNSNIKTKNFYLSFKYLPKTNKTLAAKMNAQNFFITKFRNNFLKRTKNFFNIN